MIYATDVSTYYVACKKAILYVCCRSRHSQTRCHCVTVSHSSDSRSLRPSVVRGAGNCDFSLQFVKHSCQTLALWSLVR